MLIAITIAAVGHEMLTGCLSVIFDGKCISVRECIYNSVLIGADVRNIYCNTSTGGVRKSISAYTTFRIVNPRLCGMMHIRMNNGCLYISTIIIIRSRKRISVPCNDDIFSRIQQSAIIVIRIRRPIGELCRFNFPCIRIRICNRRSCRV